MSRAQRRPARGAWKLRTPSNGSRASTSRSALRCTVARQPRHRRLLRPEPAAEAVPVTPRPASLIDTAWGFLPDSRQAYVRLHQPNYLLLGRYTTDVNTEPYEPLFDAFYEDDDLENAEAKFQLSFKGRLATTDDRRWGLWFAYTQQSQWQLYSPDISRPFRETNYMPEIFGSFRPGVDIGGWQWNLLNFGYTHQSNGRSDPISRSWDRLFVEAGIERDNFVLLARAWTRITPSDYEDDNPDIVDYYGHGEITGIYKWRDNSFTLMGRGNLATGRARRNSPGPRDRCWGRCAATCRCSPATAKA